MIDYASPSPEREAMLAEVKAELRAEHRRLTDAQIDLIADVAIELRIMRNSLTKLQVIRKLRNEARPSSE
jgi:hypothetical protein